MRPRVPLDQLDLRAQTIPVGARIELRYDVGDYDGFNDLRAGLKGEVTGSATPDIQRRQVWAEETY